MADRWMMGISRWLLVFLLVCGFRNGLGDISLTMEKTMTGVKGESVVIPCAYVTSANEEVVKIEWEFKGHPVIHRAESQDHISLVKYRDRAVLSNSPAGDVSLTLRKLDMDDRGNFKCKVTGRDGSGKLITKEDVTVLNVIRTRPATEKPKVTTAEAKVTTSTAEKIITEISNCGIETTARRDITTKKSVTETSNLGIPTTSRRDITTKASGVEDDSAIARTQQPGEFHSSPVPVYPSNNNGIHSEPAAEAVKGSGITYSMLIIGLLCLISAFILTAVMIARRKRRKDSTYNIPTMNQLASNLEERSCGGGGHQAASNNYENTFPVPQNENISICSTDYEQFLIPNPQGNDIHCQISKACAQPV